MGDNGDPIVTEITSRLQEYFKDEVNLMFNDSFFNQGKSFKDLQNVLEEPNFRICNIVLTYNFLNELKLLKTFFKAILS